MTTLSKNLLFYGDNLDILKNRIPTESVDLIYLDPPFNSNRSYNVLFGGRKGLAADEAQIHAFDDTWTWTNETDRLYFDLVSGSVPPLVADALSALHDLIGENDVMAYLVMMAPRLVELRRVLKDSGTLYLHCDPTASHFLKLLLDSVFGPKNFLNEIIWKRSSAHSDTKQGMSRLGKIHDTILVYVKNPKTYIWNPSWTEYSKDYLESEYRHVDPTGRRYKETDLTGAKPGGETEFEWRVKRRSGTNERWVADLDNEHYKPKRGWEYQGVAPYGGRYWAYSKENLKAFARAGKLIHRKTGMPRLMQFADEMPGVPLQDIWTDIAPASGAEDLGFPTQKPVKLLDRIIESSSEPGDVVLDPFCGCGTTVVSAQKLGRRWIGIDVTFIAVDLMRERLQKLFGSEVEFEIDGIPRDMPGAQALAERNKFDFERWAVSALYGRPNEKQVGDKGVDGVIRFPLPGKSKPGRVLISVKAGKVVSPTVVRDLVGTVKRERAEMGILVVLNAPTKGVVDEANHSGHYVWPVNNQTFPTIQVVSVAELFEGKRPSMPSALSPYTAAVKHVPSSEQLSLDGAG